MDKSAWKHCEGYQYLLIGGWDFWLYEPAEGHLDRTLVRWIRPGWAVTIGCYPTCEEANKAIAAFLAPHVEDEIAWISEHS